MSENRTGPQGRRRGRPVGFDRSAALERATRLFWERGFEGTSFDELVGAMGISPSSFYAAFGSKERLYQEAVDGYAAASAAWFGGELEAAPDARAALEGLLRAAARRFTEEGEPAGCMISAACTNVPPQFDRLREHVADQRRRAEAAVAARIRRGMAEGDTPPGTDAEALASFYGALLRGMAVQARDGATRDCLLAIADVGMRAWPGRDTTEAAASRG